MTETYSRALRGAVAAALLALAVGAAACGSDGDADKAPTGSAGQKGSANAQNGPGDRELIAEGGEEAEIERLFYSLQDGFYANDPKGLCEKISRSGRKELIVAPGQTCVSVLKQVIDTNRRAPEAERTHPKIRKIVVDGDTARVRWKDGDDPPVISPFVKEEGRWKVDSIRTNPVR